MISSKEKQIYFEQYKILVESAEKISDKRMTANNFFLTLNTAFISLFGLMLTSTIITTQILMNIILPLGIVLSFIWLLIILSYKQLNSRKFSLIHKLEKELPIQLFEKEWKELGEGKNMKKYMPLSHVELCVQIIFLLFYLVLLFTLC